MNRNWYLRLTAVIAVTASACLALWPSLDAWVPAPPQWLQSVFSGRISPGLDIQGGLRLTYEVEVDEAIRDRRNRLIKAIEEHLGEELKILPADDLATREQMSELRERVRVKARGAQGIRVTAGKASDLSGLRHNKLRKTFPDLREERRTPTRIDLTLEESRLEELRQTAIDQTVRTISNRIDELQVRETTIIGRDSDVIIEVPGADQATFARIRDLISRTARLRFMVLDDAGAAQALSGLDALPDNITRQQEQASAGPSQPQVSVPYLEATGETARDELRKILDALPIDDEHLFLLGRVEEQNPESASEEDDKTQARWRSYYLFRGAGAEVSGEDIEDAFVAYDSQDGDMPYVAVNFERAGAKRFERLTERNVKRRMAIVLDELVESAPVISQKIAGGSARITLGAYASFDSVLAEANDLAIVLRAGALPAPISPSNEQLIGPTLGRDSVRKGAQGAMIGIALVLVFMALYYSVTGLVADLMVVLNVLFVLAALSALEATLTLPGVAGIALTVGMAVDANVLITERIREELRTGKSPRAAVQQGFGRAFWSVFDSQLTTFIAGVVLFQYGTGPIKGFAVTLMIGICTSLFTGIFCSKVVLEGIVQGLRVRKLRVG